MQLKTLPKIFLTFMILSVAFAHILFTISSSRGASISNTEIRVDPDKSIQEAINNANPGDIIIVSQGTYKQWPIVVNKTLTIVGESLENTIIDGNGTANVIFHVNSSNVVIENFTLQNTSTDPNMRGTAIRIFNSANVMVRKVIVKDNQLGIEILSANFTRVTRCEISNNTWGIHLHDNSVNNTFVGNTIANCSIGAYISDYKSQYNAFYHNNFINNTNQASVMSMNYFDNGYPSGGNYWSDHIKTDLKHGPFQDLDEGDGIVDESYQKGGAFDKYPLLNPITVLKVSAGGKLFDVVASTNSSLKSYTFNPETKSLKLFLMGEEGTIGACRISIPKELLSCDQLSQWNITLSNNEQMIYLALEDAEITYLYFTYIQPDNYDIEIRGTTAIPEFTFIILLIVLTAITLVIVLKKRSEKLLFKEQQYRLDL